METLKNYMLTTLCGVPFLLPFGQGVAAFSRGLLLNETGALIIESLSHEQPFSWYAKQAGLAPEEIETAREDYDSFLKLLAGCGCLKASGFPFRSEESEPLYGRLKIGPLSVDLRGKTDFFADEFSPFLEVGSLKAPADQTISITQTFPPDITGSVLLIRCPDLEVYQREELFFLRFPAMPDVRLAALSHDGAHAVYYIEYPEAERSGSRETDLPTNDCALPGKEPSRRLLSLREDLFHAIRQSFLYMAQQKGFFALHSATILYRQKVWAFSGPSGTGKSTHTALWNEHFGVPLMNGDLSLLSLADDGTVLFHGMPWCGTSGIYTKKNAPLGGIVFLKQAPENRAEGLPPEQEALRLLNRLISPVWTKEMLQMNLHFSTNAASRLGIWRLFCTKTPEAAFVMKETIDQYEDLSEAKDNSCHGR